MFIVAAAQRAKRIRFGTGVISPAYHNLLWTADRLMLLDHLTHGRIIGGMGPGSLPTDNIDEVIDVINGAGAGVIGTPEQARAQVQRLWDQSGGFGCMLQMGHEWANPAATRRSAELFAAEVIPATQLSAVEHSGNRDMALRARACAPAISPETSRVVASPRRR